MAHQTVTINGIVATVPTGTFLVTTREGPAFRTKDLAWAYTLGQAIEADVKESSEGPILGPLREARGAPDMLTFRLLGWPGILRRISRIYSRSA